MGGRVTASLAGDLLGRTPSPALPHPGGGGRFEARRRFFLPPPFWGRVGVGGGCAQDLQLAQNALQHALGIAQHLVVPEAQDNEALGSEPLIAPCVIALLLVVLPAIDLYDEPWGEAGEVGDVGADRGLAAESAPSCSLRRCDQRRRSASVMFLRRSLALSRRSDMSPPTLTLPHKGGGRPADAPPQGGRGLGRGRPEARPVMAQPRCVAVPPRSRGHSPGAVGLWGTRGRMPRWLPRPR